MTMMELIDELHGLASFNFSTRKVRESLYFYIPTLKASEFANILIGLGYGFRYKPDENIFIVKM